MLAPQAQCLLGHLGEVALACSAGACQRRRAQAIAPGAIRVGEAGEELAPHAVVAGEPEVQRDRLVVARAERGAGAKRSAAAASIVPAYSRVEIAAPAASPSERPFAEVEGPSGLKVRLFIESGGALGLLSALLGAGGGR